MNELRQARVILEHAYARLGQYCQERADRDAQSIIRWAIYDVDLAIRRIK